MASSRCCSIPWSGFGWPPRPRPWRRGCTERAHLPDFVRSSVGQSATGQGSRSARVTGTRGVGRDEAGGSVGPTSATRPCSRQSAGRPIASTCCGTIRPADGAGCHSGAKQGRSYRLSSDAAPCGWPRKATIGVSPTRCRRRSARGRICSSPTRKERCRSPHGPPDKQAPSTHSTARTCWLRKRPTASPTRRCAARSLTSSGPTCLRRRTSPRRRARWRPILPAATPSRRESC